MKKRTITIKKNGRFVEDKTVIREVLSFSDIASGYEDPNGCRILLAMVPGEVCELWKPVPIDCTEIDFLTGETFYGFRAIERALTFILTRAVREICGGGSYIRVMNSIDKGVYFRVVPYVGWLNEKTVDRIRDRMKDIIAADEPFEQRYLDAQEARHLLHDQNSSIKEMLLKFRDKDVADIYLSGDTVDYYDGMLPPSTGCVEAFDIIKRDRGIVLRLPKTSDPKTLPELKHDYLMGQMFREAHHWMDIIGIPYAAQLNEAIENGTYRRVIQVAEALQEKKIAEIADAIVSTRKRIILIAGPSSSGKTSFAQRLSVQLFVQGVKSCALSTDDYFVDREFVEKDEKGNYKFEDLEAVDVKLFNEQLNSLLAGEETDIPVYNFVTGKKEFGKRPTKVADNEAIIIEGIHGLNELLTADVRAKDKFKIYISPLTTLGLDPHNRIYTADARIFRRMARDARTRNKSASETIRTWPEVRAGEEKNIFPYQEEADVMFNSALPYELAVLKKTVEPLLKEIDKDSIEYVEAKRLLRLLSYFRELPDDGAILNNSLLREFIGGTCLFED